MYGVRSVKDPLRVKIGMSMSLSPTRSGGDPARMAVASLVTSWVMDVRLSCTFRFLWVALNSSTSFLASVWDTDRAQNCTVPVALSPKSFEPVEPDGLEPPEEQAATPSVVSAIATTAARILTILIGFLASLRDWRRRHRGCWARPTGWRPPSPARSPARPAAGWW